MERATREFRPQRVIIFGSRVRGTGEEESDIDVTLVFSRFANIPFLKRMPLALRKVTFLKYTDYVSYAPSEYDRIKNRCSVRMDAI